MGYPRGASAHLGPGTCERKSETRLSLDEKGDVRGSSVCFSLHYTVFPAFFLLQIPYLEEEKSPLAVERRESSGSEC